MMKLHFWGTIVLSFMLVGAYAQVDLQPLYFKRLSWETQGLADFSAFDNMYQDRAGFIWFISNDGIMRYDGASLQLLQSNPFDLNSLSSSQTKDMLQDEQGLFWITTRKGGLNAYDPATQTFTHYRHEATDSTTLMSNDLFFLERDPAGKLWVGSTAGMNVFDPATKKVVRMRPAFGTVGALQGVPSSPIIIENEKVYVVTTAGFECYDQKTKRWQYFPLRNEAGDTLQTGINSTYAIFRNLCKDQKGVLWISMPGHDGIWTFQPERQQLRRFDQPRAGGARMETPYGIMEDRSDRIWIAAENYIWRISPDRKELEPYAAIDIEAGDTLRSFFTLYEDDSGLIWIDANAKQSVYWFDPSQEQGKTIRLPDVNQQPPGVGQIIFGKDDLIWLSTSKGIWRCHRVSGEVEQVMKMERCHFATALDERHLVVCSKKGLFVFDRMAEQYWPVRLDEPGGRTFPTTTYATLDHDGDLWVSTWGDGLYRLPKQAFDIRTGIATEYNQWTYQPSNPNSLPSNLLAGIIVDAHNMVWVAGAENGLNAVDKTTGRVQCFLYEQGREQGISDNYTWGLLMDKQGDIWISRGTKAIERFSPETGHFKIFGVDDGLPNYGIAHMALDSSGMIWLNQNQAVSSIDPQTGTIRILPQVARPSDYKDAIAVHPVTQDIYFTNQGALHRFTPSSMSALHSTPSPLRLSAVALFDPEGDGAMVSLPEKRWENGKLSLSHQENIIEISFALLDYRHPKAIQYQYALTAAGKAPNWIFIGGKNTVSLANLAPGRYQFSVKGRNGYGIWNEEPLALFITIRPPWWATGWAYLAYAFIGLLALLGLWRYELRRKLAAAEARRLRELDDFKNEFFTNITHEFRTPLTVILGTSEQLEAKVAPLWQNKLSLIRRNGEHLLHLINQILDLAKLESNTLKISYVQGDVLPFLGYIIDSLQSLADKQQVLLHLESPETSIVMDYDPERLLQIVYNLLSNAIKFTPSGGEVRLQVTVDNFRKKKGLKLSVTDTGMGIPEADFPFIFDRYYQVASPQTANLGGNGIGLALTKELTQILGGDIQVESKLNKGTTFTLRLPITNVAAFLSQLPQKQVKQPPPDLPDTFLSPTTLSASQEVLIIEDNPDVAEYLRDCLRPYYQLDFAYNGKAGIEKALETIPDLIISDVMMPGKDGFEVCENLKNDLRTSHVPIVLLTAKAGIENRIAGLQHRADAYLVKPFHEAELLVTLDNLLENRRKLQERFNGKKEVDSLASPALSPEEQFLQQVRRIIHEHLADTDFSVEDLSPRQLHRKLAALTGQSPSAFIRGIRLEKAKEFLQTQKMNVSEAAYATGFDDPKYFSRVFKKAYGLPPSKV